MAANCIFCKIIKGAIPSFKVIETELTYAFLDVGPIAKGHTLVIPKQHAQFMHELSDESLADILPVAKKVAKALNVPNYNVLQNNGKLAHQVVEHVHFHIIPKPNETEGLGVGWPGKEADKAELKQLAEKLSASM
ncbi:HIT-like domain-containing protein [Fimicolochytrium jonesii]|uniref:HIT-like domain-containing protein n=1 Tax=Fimicolochytrium jonesii TaxID=1396493 RepID=UPI0022FEA0AF|nr:HIT-like domain-containing protein [Fimicolochytrium jonesii]KAI8826562.1 HIT-like domain-containing protein [Fimicolochytrium jonesii]